MAVAGNKRSLPPAVAKMQARKKQKLEDGKTAAKASAPDAKDAEASERNSVNRTKPAKSRQKSSGKKKQKAENDESDAIDLESLKWQAVQAPEHMEDYEGFFGLEEIDGVDIVRPKDGDGGRVEYRVSGGKAKEEEMLDVAVKKKDVDERAKPMKKSGGRAKVGLDSDQGLEAFDQQGTELSGDDWSGFGSEGELDAETSDTSDIIEHDDVEHAKRPNGTSKPAMADELDSSGFEHLRDYEEEDEDSEASAWDALSLPREVKDALSAMKLSTPTEIQTAAIGKIADGHDVIGKAPTGSGKTLAFGIPIIDTCLQQKLKRVKPIALIIEPTRELAQQVKDHLDALCSQDDLAERRISISTMTGGLSIQKQRRLLEHADIIVATPGRLWEIVSEGHGTLEMLQQIQFLVIDEADRLLNEGSFTELSQFLDALKRTKDPLLDASSTEPNSDAPAIKRAITQTLVFSATFSTDLHHKLSRRQHPSSISSNDPKNPQDNMAYLLQRLPFQPQTKPLFIDVSPTQALAPNLREGLLECPATEKDLYLYTLLLHHPPGTRALIFVNSIAAVQRLVPFLNNLRITALPLHSHMEQKARLRSVERFSGTTKSSKIPQSPKVNCSTSTKLGSNNAFKPHTNAEPTTNITALIATDVAARGLDIPRIDLILHYHVPRTASGYIHRSGRTARATASGTSILLCAASEAGGVRRLVGQVHGTTKGVEEGKKKRRRSGDLKALSVNPTILARLKPRATLSKRLADAALFKAKTASADSWLASAAEDLGVDLEDPAVLRSLDDDTGKGSGKGRKRKEREREAAGLSKAEMAGMRSELRELLGRRVNTGVSVRYVAGGSDGAGVDMGKLLREREEGVEGGFLGGLGELGF